MDHLAGYRQPFRRRSLAALSLRSYATSPRMPDEDDMVIDAVADVKVEMTGTLERHKRLEKRVVALEGK